MTNQELLAKMMKFAEDNGIPIKKGTMTLDDTNFGGLIPRQQVEELLVLSRAKNDWLSSLDHRVRAGRSGTVPVAKLNENITEGVGENEGDKVATKLTTYNVPYNCKKYRSDWLITVDDVREAVAAGITDFKEIQAGLFATALGNDVADITVNSNTALDNTTRRNRMLRMVDGITVKAEQANVFDAGGKPFGKGIFAAMLDHMPEDYANDPNNHWMYCPRVNDHYSDLLTERATVLGDKTLTSRVIERPRGIAPILVEQISNTQGPGPIAPTSATDGTTFITFDLTTLITALHLAAAADGVGRRFKVKCKTTGQSEIVYGYLDTQLKVKTTGLLGQTTVSTTASDYEVGLADETDLYYGNPKGIIVVHQGEMDTYQWLNPDFHRFESVTYHYLDVLIPNPEALVKFKRVAVTPKRDW